MIAIIISILISFSGLISAEESKKEFETEEYKVFRTTFFSLYRSGKFAESGQMLEKNLDRFPAKRANLAYNAVISYLKAEQPESAVRVMQKALDRGLFFNKYMVGSPLFAPLKSVKGFDRILELNEAKRAEAQKKARATYEVVLPDNFDPKQRYPLFVALHGGSSNIRNFKPRWQSELLKKKYITAYVQSSQVISINGYHWGDLKRTAEDLKKLVALIRSKYPVDSQNILVGGFSSGGYGALYAAFKQLFPIKGYVVLCPVIPSEIQEADLVKMKQSNLSGTVLTSDIDPRIGTQKSFSARLKAAGIRNALVITPKIGHWFPKDLGKQIDRAIHEINKI